MRTKVARTESLQCLEAPQEEVAGRRIKPAAVELTSEIALNYIKTIDIIAIKSTGFYFIFRIRCPHPKMVH